MSKEHILLFLKDCKHSEKKYRGYKGKEKGINRALSPSDNPPEFLEQSKTLVSKWLKDSDHYLRGNYSIYILVLYI